MREIKFRCFDIEKGRFTVNTVPKMILSSDANLEIAETDNIKVMQYTGLKDNNGKEIYEGDIVKEMRKSRSFPDGKEIIRKIEWNESLTLDDSYGEHAVGFNLFGGTLKVIGNIYENPELLTN